LFQHRGEGYPIIDHAATLYRTLFENTGTATVLIEEDMTISLVNSELSRISGLGKEMVENRMKFPDLIAGPDRETVIRNHRLRRQDPDKAPRNYPCRVIVANGDIKECLLTVALVDGTRQSVASITDLSAQKELERRITRIGEEERRHIGRFLHDDLGSHLAGVEALASLLSSRLARSEHPEAGLAQEIKTLINQAVKKTKHLAQGLVPVDMAATGFMDTLGQYVRHVEKAFGVLCRIHGDISEASLPLDHLTHLYYIVREAVNNAARHSGAGEVDIRFSPEDGDYLVRVSDNGRGFFHGGAPAGGLGHQIMKQRADLIHADLAIHQNDKGGTTVQCRIKNRYAS
jgi:PAS domain S-box-containing protein